MQRIVTWLLAIAAALSSAAGAAPNYSDSWWNPNESGWGLTITDHETDLFVQWYTYDQTGHNEKFVISGGTFTADKCTFTAAVQRVNGPAWYAATFDPTKVVRTTVGAARLEFCNPTVPAGDMVFNYTVDGISGMKQMTRLSFGNDAPHWGGNANTAAFGIDYTDLWWNPAESGWGVSITQHGNNVFFRIFVYDSDGRPLLFVVPGVTMTSPTSFTGAVQMTSGPFWGGQVFDPTQVVRTTVGTATLSFNDARNGTLSYTVNGQTVAKPITRMIYGNLITPNIASTYPAGSQELLEFNAVNKFRQSLGLQAWVQNARIDQAATNHANYGLTSWQPGDDPHAEIAGRVGFTGVTPIDRIKATGYPSLFGGEDMAVPDPLHNLTAVEVLESVMYHRVGLMDQVVTDVGLTSLDGVIVDTGGTTTQQNVPANYVGLYPLPGQVGVGQIHRTEAPNPFPELAPTMDAMCANTGYPISVSVHATGALNVVSYAVTEEGQTVSIPARIIARNGGNYTASQLVPPNVAFLITKTPLKTSTKYNVKFVGQGLGAIYGTSGMMQLNLTWSFTTGATNIYCH